jgi:hypothetical protein
MQLVAALRCAVPRILEITLFVINNLEPQVYCNIHLEIRRLYVTLSTVVTGYTYWVVSYKAQYNTTQKDEYSHPCLKRDSNPRSERPS